MSGNALRVVAGVVVIALAVLLYVVLSSSDDEETISSAAKGVPLVVVEDGEPQGGIKELTYNSGEPIRFRVESDVADEVHFHGYDVGKDVEAGGASASICRRRSPASSRSSSRRRKSRSPR